MRENDENLMSAAIALAEQCTPIADRIPKVGVVIAVDGTVIGQGHRGTGESGDDDHAEKIALKGVVDRKQLPKATVYTTLEPCTPEVRSDPSNCCTELIRQAEVERVFIGILDPNHQGITFGGSSGGATGPHNKAFNNFLAGNLNETGGPANTVQTMPGNSPPIQGGNIGQTSILGIFVNYQGNGSGDYHLKTGSPAINAGTSGTTNCAVSPGISPCIPTTDFSGTSRPQGSAIDIGAYEQ